MRTFLLFSSLLVACNGGDDDPGTDPGDDPGTTEATGSTGATGTYVTPCAYPEGAVDPMTLGEVMPAFSWPDARNLDGRTASLELEKAACDDDDDIDWSPHDVLVFVSIPAW